MAAPHSLQNRPLTGAEQLGQVAGVRAAAGGMRENYSSGVGVGSWELGAVRQRCVMFDICFVQAPSGREVTHQTSNITQRLRRFATPNPSSYFACLPPGCEIFSTVRSAFLSFLAWSTMSAWATMPTR